MSEFIQLHILVSYPPSNLNRDDMGRPKTAVVGGRQRLRVSSQSLKRAWRTSDLFDECLHGCVGIRTKDLGCKISEALTSGKSLVDIISRKADAAQINEPMPEDMANIYSSAIADAFGDLKPMEEWSNGPVHKQMVHYNPSEIRSVDRLISGIFGKGDSKVDTDTLKALGESITGGKKLDKKVVTRINEAVRTATLNTEDNGVDLAMFGRMLASSPAYNVEAAVQVSHAITVNEAVVEDDYFTAVDDLNRGEEDMGAGHVGEAEFGSGVFYIYACVNYDLLVKNLDGNRDTASKTLKALVEAATKVSPNGKQNSFASRAYASYILAEKGKQQPRSLSVAFIPPVRDVDMVGTAIQALKDTRGKMDAVYGACCEEHMEMNAHSGEGSLREICDFVAGDHAA